MADLGNPQNVLKNFRDGGAKNKAQSGYLKHTFFFISGLITSVMICFILNLYLLGNDP